MASAQQPVVPAVGLLDSDDVAALLGCSTRHLQRLVAGNRMPRPVRIGGLVRWRRADIEAWIDASAGGSIRDGREVPRV